VLYFGGAYYNASKQLEMVEASQNLLAYDTQGGAFLEVQAAGPLPCPRNAGVMVPLGPDEVLLHGGWRAFVETYNDTHIMRLGG